MARHGVSFYRAVDDRHAQWEREHPREAAILWWVRNCTLKINQWQAVVDWTDRICARQGRSYAPEYHELVRKINHLRRMREAWWLRLKEIEA